MATLLPRRLLTILVALGACREQGASSPAPISASEFHLTEGKKVRATLAVVDGAPTLSLLDRAGKPRARLALDASDRPSLALFGAGRAEPTAVLELDEKGGHVLFRGPEHQESYLFQKEDGTAGIVLVGKNGKHRGQLLLSASGEIDASLFDDDGHARHEIAVSADGEPKKGTQ